MAGVAGVNGMRGDPGRIRTFDPEIRNLVLYPAELRDQPANIRTLFARAQMGGVKLSITFFIGTGFTKFFLWGYRCGTGQTRLHRLQQYNHLIPSLIRNRKRGF